MLNAPDYRARYAHGLRYLFPRVPIARNPRTFDQIRKVGAKLVALHLLEDPELETAGPRLDGDDTAVLDAPVYDPDAQEIHLAADLRAHPISGAAWAYRQGLPGTA